MLRWESWEQAGTRPVRRKRTVGWRETQGAYEQLVLVSAKSPSAFCAIALIQAWIRVHKRSAEAVKSDNWDNPGDFKKHAELTTSITGNLRLREAERFVQGHAAWSDTISPTFFSQGYIRGPDPGMGESGKSSKVTEQISPHLYPKLFLLAFHFNRLKPIQQTFFALAPTPGVLISVLPAFPSPWIPFVLFFPSGSMLWKILSTMYSPLADNNKFVSMGFIHQNHM